MSPTSPSSSRTSSVRRKASPSRKAAPLFSSSTIRSRTARFSGSRRPSCCGCYDNHAMVPTTDSGPARLEAKLLYRRLDRLFGAWERSKPQGELLEAFSEELFGALKDDLRLRGVLLY